MTNNNNNNKEIIAFCGVIGSGKTFGANNFINTCSDNCIKLSFADTLREKAFEILGYTPSNYSNFKTRLLFLDKCPTIVSTIVHKLIPQWITGRNLLENVGTIYKQDDKDYWTKSLFKKMDKLMAQGNKIVIDDLRFKKEVVSLQKHCATNDIKLTIIFRDFKSDKYCGNSAHSSEQLAQFMRDTLRFTDGYKIPIVNCFYYNVDNVKYKTAVPIYDKSFLEESDKMCMDNLNDFEEIVTKFIGE